MIVVLSHYLSGEKHFMSTSYTNLMFIVASRVDFIVILLSAIGSLNVQFLAPRARPIDNTVNKVQIEQSH